ncbi:MAG TPA: glycine cleavage system protein GcvH [Armatimonadetes bacterium]|nr:glycine cleavage system protein GcvH [Armatimonadota bacterium]
METPADLRFLPSHEWCRVEGDRATFGITDHAQNELGDVVAIELPAEGDEVTAGQAFGSVDSVKATSELIAPLSGTVVEVHEALIDQPELINESPYAQGWMVTIDVSDPAEADALLDLAAYEASL